ncbi:MAG TPA: carbohydrate kinase, partial [Planctomycetota bacterium]|nr:carbohydrate kinase [Planctomycetota bacterium]
DRRMFLRKNAGHITADEVPPIDAAHLHLAGISDQEFSLELICNLVERGYNLSVDMQSFVRQVDPDTGEVSFRNVMLKRPIVNMVRKVKLDVVEAKLLTGEDDLEQAALALERWGCPEIVITESKGVLARVAGTTFYERFTNRSNVGRTGRGDTTFAAYLAWRIDHDPAESLRFAAALVSIKMERPGPFSGTKEEVLRRMAERE